MRYDRYAPSAYLLNPALPIVAPDPYDEVELLKAPLVPDVSYCLNCSKNTHRANVDVPDETNCPFPCFKCRMKTHQRGPIPFKDHLNDCRDIVPGFMTRKFETLKCQYYHEGRNNVWPKYYQGFRANFYTLLSELTPENADKFQLKGEAGWKGVRVPAEFANTSGKSLVTCYQWLVKKLVVIENFEFEMHSTTVRNVDPVLVYEGRRGQDPFSVMELEFECRNSYMRNEILANASHGFLIFLAFPERTEDNPDGKVFDDRDFRWPKNLPRQRVCPVRRELQVYEVRNGPDNGKCRLLIQHCQLLERFIEGNNGHIPVGDVFLSFSYRSQILRNQLSMMENYIKCPVAMCCPRILNSVVDDYFSPNLDQTPLNEVHDGIRLEELQSYNDELPNQCRLTEEQLEAVWKSFQKEVFAITGPPGSGKTTIVCFIALFNWYILGRKTLIFETRTAAAVAVTYKLRIMVQEIQRRIPRLSQGNFLWHKTSRLSAFKPRPRLVSEITSHGLSVPKGTGILISVCGLMNSSAVINFGADHIVNDEASSMTTADLMSLWIYKNELAATSPNARNPGQPKQFLLLGDYFQLNPRFHQVRFLADDIEEECGFKESVLLMLLKRKLPSFNLKKVCRGSHTLYAICQAYYDYKFDLSCCSNDSPLLFIFPPQHGLPPSMRQLVDRPFISLFLNLARKGNRHDGHFGNFCDADDRHNNASVHQGNRRFINQRNVNAAKAVLNLACNEQNDLRFENCMYLTGYRMQQTLFEREKKSGPWRCETVPSFTIDMSISLEADFVVLDFVRTRDEGFLVSTTQEWPCYPDVQRLLVGLSRSKRGQVILASVDEDKARRCPKTYLEKLAHFHMWNHYNKAYYFSI